MLGSAARTIGTTLKFDFFKASGKRQIPVSDEYFHGAFCAIVQDANISGLFDI